MTAPTVSSEAVAAYRPLVAKWARRFSRLDLAEYDDLVQVGLIKVWILLRDGRFPDTKSVCNAMKDELRRAGRGGWAGFDPIPDDLDGEHRAVDPPR